MSRHPVTPMDEADLRLHLARQTDKAVGLFDVLDLGLTPGAQSRRLATLLSDDGNEIVLFDVMTDEHLRTIGGFLARPRLRSGGGPDEPPPRFAVGSSALSTRLLPGGAARAGPWSRRRFAFVRFPKSPP
jgi:uncharacterized protein YgbK (DUF1537 family)